MEVPPAGQGPGRGGRYGTTRSSSGHLLAGGQEDAPMHLSHLGRRPSCWTTVTVIRVGAGVAAPK
ncbi:MAG: hypothetical protein R3F05_07285 [Planctomycetota bacterium]